MILSSNITDFSSGTLGLVELAASYLNDRAFQQWAKAELIAYINQEQQKLANIINEIYETYFVTSATTTSVLDQAKYSLPTQLVQLMGIEIADSTTDSQPQSMTEIHFTDREFYTHLNAVNDKKEHGYFFVTGRDFTLAPVDGEGGKTIRTFYVERLTDLADDADVSQIPLEHHELLALGAARRGRLKMGRSNPALDSEYKEQIEILKASIAKFSPQREEITEPFFGTAVPSYYRWGRTVD